MTAAQRAQRTEAADAMCASAYQASGGIDVGAALVAVGGYGRGELAPFSDLDVVLVCDDGVEVQELAEKVWYPLWDSGSTIDHSVRTFSQMIAAAEDDVRVASGLLDIRHVAGDPNLTLRLRATMLAQWRRGAKNRLPDLQAMVRARQARAGELAHLSIPDLKEATGGLRDATVLNALVATWLIDVPHADLERSRQALLDVRDLVHGIAGRATDRITPEMWGELAPGLALEDDRAVQVYVRGIARRITHLSRLAWRRVDDLLRRPTSATAPRRPQLEPLADGVALSQGEVVLDRRARPANDPVLLLRAATAAAEKDALLAPATAARLVRECGALPNPWPTEARQLLVRLLASGRGLLGVWETLEETGALNLILPEWERIHLVPHASVIHRFTVARHVVETCMEASGLIRTVARPDVLMISALLHDIGKGGLVEHSIAGEPIARAIATRMGFEQPSVDLIALLVRWHLLLAQTATTRDPDDPATVETITSRLGTPEAVSLLIALTEADAKATSPKAWSSWRSGLIRDLGRRAHASLDSGTDWPAIRTEDQPIPQLEAGAVSIEVEPVVGGARVTTIAVDRVGLLANLAAMFALQRTPVRAARIWSQGEHAVAVWEIAEEVVDPAILRTRYAAIVDGRLDPTARLQPADSSALAPSVVVQPEASEQSTVLEVRAADRPGVVYLVCAALASLGIAVRSAHLDTLGPQAVDVFYLQEDSAGVLSDERAAEAAHAVREALTSTDTRDA